MASTAAGVQAIIDAIDTLILAKLAGADVQSYQIGSERVDKMSIAQLTELRRVYQAQVDAINSGTEYTHHYDTAVDRTGRDGTTKVGEDE